MAPAAKRQGDDSGTGTFTVNRRRKGLIADVRRLGWILNATFYDLGRVFRFFMAILARLPAVFRRFGLVWRQIYYVGTLSMIIIVVSAVFIGLVLGLQFYTILDRYGQTQIVGAAAALTLYRELGPVLTALLYVGCACTAMTAAIGQKRATAQIDAMAVMAVDPIEREIAPRFYAGVIALPLLTMVLLAISIFGTYLIAVVQIGLDEGFFWSNIIRYATFFGDVTNGLLKSFAFGIATTLTAVYQGYHATPTAEGVAQATTKTVIMGSLLVLGIDFIMTALMLE